MLRGFTSLRPASAATTLRRFRTLLVDQLPVGRLMMDPWIQICRRPSRERSRRRSAAAASPPGAILQQEALAERFAASRQPVRLALEILRANGLVVARRDRSLEVAGLSAEALRELMAIRRLVEREALTLALPASNERDLLEARQIQERIEIETDPAALEELDCAFHTALYRAGGNARLLRLMAELRREDIRPYASQPPGSANRERFARQHRALLHACSVGNLESALAALDDHFAVPMGD